MTSRSCRVLLVEDNAGDAELFAAALHRAAVPWSLRVATGRQEAIRALRQPSPGSDNVTWSQPDIVVLDLRLGQESGFHVLRWVRTQEGTRHLPVILLSSETDPGIIEQAEEYGSTLFVTKPAGLEGLVDVVRELHGRLCHA